MGTRIAWGRLWLVGGSKHEHGLQEAISVNCLNSNSALDLHDSLSTFILWVKRAVIILPFPSLREVLNSCVKAWLHSFIHSFNKYSLNACHVLGPEDIVFLEIAMDQDGSMNKDLFFG